ncbi:MAG TPA: SDR family NAD(P)-dependent oxidoreductase [Pyrinomonadaceae bacterium]|nr:SDR family NAD(P)-dependent oxidoreductase [Pyrinomonadaceae bacterium]
MSDHTQRIDGLSAERRELLIRLLEKKGQQYNVFPLSFAQQRMWFLYRSEPESPFYNVALKIRLNGTLNILAMERALSEIVRRHEVLRTTFTSIDGAPVQVIAAHKPLQLPLVDLSQMNEGEREARATQIIEEEAKRPFDLERGPVVRARLVRLEAQAHLLLFCTHHIVVDGWAIGVLLKELSSLYESYVYGAAPQLPELTIQYADYARQQQQAGAKLYESHLDYWKKKLSGSSHVLELPTERPRPAVQTYRGAHESLSFPAELVDSLKSFAQQEGVTLFMLLVAGYEALLHRYTGRTDFNIGTPVSGRSRPELESLVGLFSNTLILRADVSGALTFQELIERVRRTCLEAYTHQELPFDKVVEVLQPERDASRHPLVQVTFSLQNEALAQQASLKAMRLPGLAASLEDVETGTVQFDLILTVEQSEQELRASFSYNADLFDAAFMRHMLGHYERLLEGAVRAPQTLLAELPLLSREEEERLLAQGTGPQREYARGHSLTELFDAQAARTPSCVAVSSGERRLTYAELERRANRLANYLRSQDLGEGSTVGLFVRASEELAVSALGILKAGAALLPLSPSATPFELESLKSLQLSALVFEDESAREFESLASRVIRLDDNRARINEQSADAPAQSTSAESIAYILPREASDGGAISVLHGTAQNRLRWLQETCPVASGEAVLYRSTMNVETALCDLLWPLISGGRLVLSAESESAFESLPAIVEREQVVATRLVASEIARLVEDASVTGEAVRGRLASLRWVICAGEPLAQRTLDTWRRLMSHAVICECQTVAGTEVLAVLHQGACEAVKPEAVQGGEAFAGYPVNNVSVVVVNEAGRMMPAGAWGEVSIGGEALAGVAGNGRLRTAWRGRWLADGRLMLEAGSGRAWIDDRLVAYGEVEAALLAVEPGVQECAVRARRTRRGTRLVAYLVKTGRASNAELSERLAHRLPSYQMPQHFVELSSLPLTSKGAVDEAALAAVPLIEEAELRKLEEQLRGVPRVYDAAVVVHEALEQARTLHLTDLFDDAQGREDESAEEAGAHLYAEATTRQAFCDGGPLKAEGSLPRNLKEMLYRAAQNSSKGITYLSGTDVRHYSYGELLREAERLGGWLKAKGARAGEPVILQLEDNREFLSTFWACVLEGIVPVPLATASSYEQEGQSIRMLKNVWQMLESPLVVTSSRREADIRALLERASGAKASVISVEEADESEAQGVGQQSSVAERAVESIAEESADVALLLFTSGSTGKPKGVQLTHRNIIRMSAGIAELNGYHAGEVTLNWMPLTHVGGLVMFHLRDVFLGCAQLHAGTNDILENPLRWLDVIQDYGVTVTWAPNFAFKLINDHARLIRQRSWNLSSLRLIANGGEVVNAQTTMTFLGLLAKDGLAPTAMRPGFGMSETSSSIISSEALALGSERGLQRVDVLNGNKVLAGSNGSARAATFVEVGLPAPGLQVRIVDRENRQLSEDTIGRLQVRGAQVTPGYYRNDEANREAFCEDGWLNTGDLGFLHDGRLTVTGREKDVIIVNGVNFYAPEIEAVVETVEGVEGSYTAACAVRERDGDTDKLAIFFHSRLRERTEQADLVKRIRETVARRAGINADYVLLLEKSEIPKTDIGKIQRAQLKQQFEQGGFAARVKELDLALENSNTLPDWFYRQVWVPKRIAHLHQHLPKTCLVFMDERGLGTELCAELKRRGSETVSVKPGTDFLKQSREQYLLNPSSPEHYRELMNALAVDGITPEQLLHLWAYDEEASEGREELEEAQERGLYSLLWLAQALAVGEECEAKLNVVTCQSQEAGRPELIRAFQHSTLPGFLRSLRIELPSCDVRHLDLEAGDARVNVSLLLEELRAVKGEAEVSYRGGQRLVARLERLEMLEAERRPVPFQRGGLYLVSGALGGVGARVSEYLIKHYDVRLLLVGRTSLAAEQDAKVFERQERLRAIEAAGGQGSCLYRAVDVCDREGLRQAVEEAELLFGRRLDGVLHLAGEEDLARHWQEMERYWAKAETREHVASTLGAKLTGTWNLFELLKERGRAVFISFSSVNSVFGAATFAAYSAANSFLDGFSAYSRAHNSNVETWSFNWTVWDGIGMSATGPEYAREVAQSLGYSLMTAEQGMHSLMAGLSRPPMNVVVGLNGTHEEVRRRLQGRQAKVQRVSAFYTSRDEAPSQSELKESVESFELETGALVEFQKVESLVRAADGAVDERALLERAVGNLKSEAFHAPQGEVEKQLLEVWKKVLEVERVGVNDKFFEVGGNSLKSLRLLAAINQRFSCQVAVADLFKFSTVKALGSHIEKLTSNGHGNGNGNGNGGHKISGFEL